MYSPLQFARCLHVDYMVYMVWCHSNTGRVRGDSHCIHHEVEQERTDQPEEKPASVEAWRPPGCICPFVVVKRRSGGGWGGRGTQGVEVMQVLPWF